MSTDLGLPIYRCPDSGSAPRTDHGSYKVLGVRVDAVQIPQVIERVERWIAESGQSRYVAVTGMHGVTEAQRSERFRGILGEADLVVADGMPLVWLGRWHGHNMQRRVYGPELTESFCQVTGAKYRHFFYGGAPGVADELGRQLQQRYGIRVAGTCCPPFRALTAEEDRAVVRQINEANPDVVWVGLSTPKQETWMYEHRHNLSSPVMFGIGAAFDLNIGKLRQAPEWMRENGLEWLFRLVTEPRRLWRRYLVFAPIFAWKVSLELLGLRVFE